MVDLFDADQTVTAEGKVWSLKRPVLLVSEGCKDFEAHNLHISGQGANPTRVAAGMRVCGATGGRWLRGRCVVEDCESYGVVIGDTAAKNRGAINCESLEIKVNGRLTRQDRTSYGLVLSGNDMDLRNLKCYYAHAPLLVTEFGATTRFIGHDFFNGASFDTEGFPHRVMEYHGNSCLFSGGRWGNGSAHIWNKDVAIAPSKFGITEGTTDLPPAYFILYATKAGDDLRNFALSITNDVPWDLKSTIPWLYLEAPTAPNSWAVDAAALSDIYGYLEIIPSGKANRLQGSTSDRGAVLMTGIDGSYQFFRDRTTTQNVGIGVVGDALKLRSNDLDRWEVLNNGTLRPVDDIAKSFGGPGKRVKEVYAADVFVGAGARITSGSGSPEGVVTAGPGSLYTDSTAGALYLKTSGTGNTGWTLK